MVDDATRTYFRYEAGPTIGVISSPDCNILYHAKGKEILSGTLESLASWNSRTGTLVKSWNEVDNKSVVSVIKISPKDENIVAVGYVDGSIRIWNLEKDEVSIIFRGHKTAVTALTFDSTGSRLASGSKDTDVVLWDLITESGLFRLRGHNNAISALEFLNDNYLISSSKDTLVKLWDLQAQHCIETIVQHRVEVTAFQVTVDKSLLITTGGDQYLRIFTIDHKALESKLQTSIYEDGTTGAIENVFSLLGEVQKSSKDRGLQLTILNSHNIISVLSADKSMEIFKFSSVEDVKKKLQRRKKRLREKKSDAKEEEMAVEETESLIETQVEASDLLKPLKFFRLDNKMRSFDYAPTNKASSDIIKIAFGSTANTIEEYLVDLEEKEREPQRVASLDLPGHRAEIKGVAVSSDGKLVLSASAEAVKIWNSDSGACVRTLECDQCLSAHFIQQNEYVLVGTKDGLLRVFELSSGVELEPIQAHQGPVWSIALRPDRKGFATGSGDKMIKFWEFKNSSTRAEGFKIKNIRSLQVADDVLCVRYSPDCRFIAASLLDLTVKVFFEDTLKFYLNCFGHKLPVMSIDISHDSKLLISASADKNVKIWGLDFGDCRKSIFAHSEAITSVSFLPRTYQFVTSSKDKTVKYWTDEQYMMLQKIEAHQAEVWGLALSPRGNVMATVSSDRSIRIWTRSEEQIFPEEERENQMDEVIENSLLTDNVHDEAGKEGEEVGTATKKTMETLRASEKIADAVEAADEETEKLAEYDAARAAGREVPEPTPGPYFMTVARGKTPAEFVMMTFEQVPAVELEIAILSLPFDVILSIFNYVEQWLHLGLNISLTSKILTTLIRLYYPQIIADSRLRVRLERIRELQKSKLTSFRDLMGLNAKIMSVALKHWQVDHTVAFDATKTASAGVAKRTSTA